MPEAQEQVAGAQAMAFRSVAVVVLLGIVIGGGVSGCLSSATANDQLPAEPDLTTRVDELYDHEARLFIALYSLAGDGQIDYVTARVVREYARSAYGNPVYLTEAQPIFYWWNHTMWNDPEQDGVNGNERVYQENTDFDISRYKPCQFNRQPC